MKSVLVSLTVIFGWLSVLGQQFDNFALLVKDTSVVAGIRNGVYSHPAIEIAAKSEFKKTPNRGFPIRVAIDPGHIATSKKEAVMEERYVRSKQGFFYEAELNMATALELKRKLEARNFEVMITRSPKATALGMSYDKWFKKYSREALCSDLSQNKITRNQYEELIRLSKKDLFHKYFKDKDFQVRKDLINAFQPDITLIIHYNATEFENTDKAFAPEVDYNYAVAFVPGGFTNKELETESQLNDFIRLASTDIVEKSVILSSFIVDEFETKLGAPKLLPTDNPDLWYLKKYSVYTGTPGVFSRNLYLTRAISSPMCYGESLLQNNANEVIKLSKRDTKVGPYKISSRVLDVADCYYTGTIKYFSYLGWLK